MLRHLKHQERREDALVGYETSDDAAVYRLSKSLAVVETVDFFPPVVDDPYRFGQIGAANALSDIWAMGAKPLFALNLVGFPAGLPRGVLTKILAGGQSKAAEAGIPVLGGHSIQDNEPKYGMAVTGLVHPRRILSNAGSKPGDVLLLTKPLGSGIAAAAIKRGLASRELARRAISVMTELNRASGEVFASGELKVSALTDVTGFGLLGHLLQMMVAARTRARLFLERVPVIVGVPALAERQVLPGGTKANLAAASKQVRFPRGLPHPVRWVLADPQTNGGLLASVPARQAGKAIALLSRAKVEAALVGEVVEGRPGIEVL